MTKQILNLIADQLNVLIMIIESENHAVTFLSRSAEWLFGIKREVISCAEDLFKQLDLYEKYPEVQKFCRESVKYTIAFEHAFSMPGKPEPVWIMVRMAPGEQGEKYSFNTGRDDASQRPAARTAESGARPVLFAADHGFVSGIIDVAESKKSG